MGYKISIFLGSILISNCSSPLTNQDRHVGVAHTSEAWDDSNRPSLLGAGTLTFDQLTSTSAKRGSLISKPWRDSYWAYTKKNIAFRYQSEFEFSFLSEQIYDSELYPENAKLSPAEKYDVIVGDSKFSVTTESWSLYDRFYSSYGEDFERWGWMGICSGWAPASISEPAPKNHVLVVNDKGQEVLLFNGDIRALLSKVYDLNRTESGFRTVGLRCNEDEVDLPRNKYGRIVDGKFEQSGNAFSIVSDYSATSGALEVVESDSSDLDAPSFWIVTDTPFRRISGASSVWQYATRNELADDLRDKTLGHRAISPNKQSLIFYKGCRDVNPASLHLSLVSNLSDSAKILKGFIVEMTRAREVWNHPLWGFVSTIGHPISLAYTTSRDRLFRAPGTTHIVEVETRLIYINGVKPAIEYRSESNEPIDWAHYESNPTLYNTLSLRYTLELDETGMIIGGEWHKDLDYNPKVPDFYWRTHGELTDQRKDGSPSILKYSLIKKLNQCSQQVADTTRQLFISGSMRVVEAVSCSL